jgi:hypothetical protein
MLKIMSFGQESQNNFFKLFTPKFSPERHVLRSHFSPPKSAILAFLAPGDPPPVGIFARRNFSFYHLHEGVGSPTEGTTGETDVAMVVIFREFSQVPKWHFGQFYLIAFWTMCTKNVQKCEKIEFSHFEL